MTGTEVATVQGTGALALRGDQADWTEMQQAALAQIGVAEAPRGDQLVLLHVSQRTGLDPFAKQIYMIGRNDKDAPGGKKWTIQTGIEGFRVVSERHPQYGGVTDPDAEWCGEDGVWRDVWLDDTKPPVAARFGVLRKDFPHPVRAVARYSEYVQTKYSGEPNSMWRKMSAHMLAKCAEALARRKAFPQDLGNVYTDDEMGHVDNPPPVIVQSERAEPTEPDWDGLIAQHQAARDVQGLWDLRKLAQGMRPNDGGLLNRIAQAWQDTRTAAAESPPDKPAAAAKPSKGRMNHLFGLLAEAGVKTTEARHRLASHVLERDINSFADLPAAEVDDLIRRLEQRQADAAAQGTEPDDTPAEQPEPVQPTEGEQR